MEKDQRREFYRLYPPDLRYITDLNKRHFRFLLPNGRFFKVKDVIRSPEALQKWMVRLHPLDVYYSTSTYLDPTAVASRPKQNTDYWGPGNVVLSNDIAFDLDRSPLSLFNLERARKDAVRLLDMMIDLGYSLKYAAFSGSKGFHLIFQDEDVGIEPDIHLREKTIIQRRKDLVALVLEKGIKIDSAVTIDTRRIIRLPGTINSKTGYCCQCLSEVDLRSPVSSWIERISQLEEHAAIPRFRMRPLPKRRKARKVTAIKDVEYGYTTFISSSVLGTKGRHAVLFSLPKGPQEQVIAALRQVQMQYELTDIYLFELPRSYQAVCLKTVQRNRYQKILDQVQSPSASQLRNYERVSLRMGPLVDEQMNIIEPDAQFLTYLECAPEIRESNFVSRGHILFLRKHGMIPLEYRKVHGLEEFKLIDAQVRL